MRKSKIPTALPVHRGYIMLVFGLMLRFGTDAVLGPEEACVAEVVAMLHLLCGLGEPQSLAGKQADGFGG